MNMGSHPMVLCNHFMFTNSDGSTWWEPHPTFGSAEDAVEYVCDLATRYVYAQEH